MENIDINLTLITSSNIDITTKFRDYYKGISTRLNILFRETDGVDKIDMLPAIRFDRDDKQGNIYYHFIPEGKEEVVLLEAIDKFGQKRVDLSREAFSVIKRVHRHILMKVFIAPHCPFCPQVVSLANNIAIASEKIETHIIDGTLFPDVIQSYGITAAPTVILEDDYVLVGTEAKDKLISWIQKAADKREDIEYYRAILKEGKADDIADRFMSRGAIPDTFLELLKDKEWPSRLGAMVVLESIYEKDPDLLRSVFPIIINMLKVPMENNNIKEDIVYLLGKIGDEKVMSDLKDIENDDSSLKEVVEEAIAAIKERP